jgi:putative FmdB family regulatory protein
MPTYEYRCRDCRHELEVVQSFQDEALTECPACGGSLGKLFGNVGITFKGSGFYKTDSRAASVAGGSKGSNGGDKAGASGDSSGGSSGDSSGGSSDGAGSSSSGEKSDAKSNGSKDSGNSSSSSTKTAAASKPSSSN